MKVVFQSYNTCCQNKSGGVNNRVHKLKDLLEQSGIEVDYFNQFTSNLQDYDVLHVFMIDHENYGLIKYAKANGIKVVISSIISLGTGKKVDFNRVLLSRIPLWTDWKMMIQSARLADCIIAETEEEKYFLIKHYNVDADKIRIIPNGVDRIENPGEQIFSYLGSKKKFVLQVGRFDNNKNQLNVIRAMKDTDIDIVFIGGPDHTSGKAYYEECIEEATGKNNIHFLGWQKQNSEILRSAYCHADTLILPSFNETFGLVLLEAGMAGAKLAISNTLPILEYDVFKECNTFNPKDSNEIRNVLIKTLNAPKDNRFREKLEKTFSWNSVIDEHIEIYHSLS